MFSDYALGKSVDYPIVSMANAEYLLRVGENLSVVAKDIPKNAMPHWRRWNNYGIALMDQRQYPLAIDAFVQAAALDEKYRPTAHVNQAIGLIELDQYEEFAN